jgi:hypothetical protein
MRKTQIQPRRSRSVQYRCESKATYKFPTPSHPKHRLRNAIAPRIPRPSIAAIKGLLDLVERVVLLFPLHLVRVFLLHLSLSLPLLVYPGAELLLSDGSQLIFILPLRPVKLVIECLIVAVVELADIEAAALA